MLTIACKKKESLCCDSFFLLPIHSHSLHGHRHAPCAAATTRELVAFEGDDAFLHVVEVDSAVDHLGGREDVESSFVQGLQGVLVAAVADEFAGLEAEEVAAAVPLLAGRPVVVAVATVDSAYMRNLA